jgi:hypothetical protein
VTPRRCFERCFVPFRRIGLSGRRAGEDSAIRGDCSVTFIPRRVSAVFWRTTNYEEQHLETRHGKPAHARSLQIASSFFHLGDVRSDEQRGTHSSPFERKSRALGQDFDGARGEQAFLVRLVSPGHTVNKRA